MDNRQFQGFVSCLSQHTDWAIRSDGRRITKEQFVKELTEKDAELGKAVGAYLEAGARVKALIDHRTSEAPLPAALPLEFNAGGHLL